MAKNYRTFLRLALGWLLCLACAGAQAEAQGQTSSDQYVVKRTTVWLKAGIHLIKAEVAATPQQQQRGLMYREFLGENEGMLFVNAEPRKMCMWMKNTVIPLSVAFIDAKGKIVNIAGMTPHTTTAYCSHRAVRFALEMNRGWFKARGIRPGSVIHGMAE